MANNQEEKQSVSIPRIAITASFTVLTLLVVWSVKLGVGVIADNRDGVRSCIAELSGIDDHVKQVCHDNREQLKRSGTKLSDLESKFALLEQRHEQHERYHK